ncbi:DUF262 domain-containing protein [Marinoscillum sp.]|uniref:DUF262 domain-containing protein n=1 Tax=Marinoscillum sp. TaxID=2024838 RepID=UPI003BAC97B2
MEIEFKIAEGEFVVVSPFRVIGKEGKTNEFQLLDSEKHCWMELSLDNSRFSLESIDNRINEPDDIIRDKLDSLVIKVIEAEQEGTDLTELPTIQEERPFNPDEIKVNAKQFSLRLITEMIDSEDMDLSPDFQRNFVWNNFQKSRLIESILLRIPLPMFYFSEDEEGRISVVDGLQRITTIKEFMDNKFPLRNLEYLSDSCDGRYYQDEDKKKGLDPKYVRWFNQTQFSVNVIDPTSPSKVKYDIFRRINTGGKPLNNQEIRNCLSGKALRSTLKQMTELEEFKSATDHSIKSTRMEDHEVALRFVLFHRMIEKYGSIEQYNGYMDPSLDDLTDELQFSKESELSKYVDLFSNSMKNAEYLLGARYAFRKITPDDLEPYAYKQLINKALFASLSVLLSEFDHEEIKNQNSQNSLQMPLAELIEDDGEFWNFLSYGTNGRSNLLYSFGKVQELINQHLNFQ